MYNIVGPVLVCMSVYKGCQRKKVPGAVFSSGQSYAAAGKLKFFQITHMGLVKTIKLINIKFFVYKYPQ